jgi:L-ascorbate metabolism protein UlaG (beta-lactamase superfamily)
MKSFVLTLIVLLCSSVTYAQQQKGIEVTWLGHAAFEVVSAGGTRLLIDPFLTLNPKTPAAYKDLTRYKPNAILISHSHSDHSANAEEIATTSGASVIGSFDYVSTLKIPDGQKMGGNVGGTFTIGDVSITIVPAMHESLPGGRPVGFVVRFADGRSLYHTGDTWIFGDMALIQELYKPSIVLLNVGGGYYTQDPSTAALAIKKFFNPEVIVPMHFGTFPVISTEDQVKAAFKNEKKMVMMTPGEKRVF